MDLRTVLVLGATGTQGGAVCRHLSASGGFRGIAITRNPGAKKAQKVAELANVELAQCDADSAESLDAVFSAYAPLFGVFSVQVNDYTEEGDTKEVDQGRRVVDLCEKHEVKHLVYTSVAELKPVHLPDVATKIEIERHLHASNVPFTILRPAFFVENFFSDGFGAATASTIGYPGFDPSNSVKQQYIYIDDLGMIAAQVFSEGAPWFGQTLELAGDALTPSELAAAFADHNGRPMLAQELPVEAFGEAVMPLFAFMRDTGWPEIDIDALRERFPRLHTVKGALEHSGYKPPES